MDVKYILVILIVILFIVNIAFVFYMNSQVSALQSAYSSLTSSYNTALSDYSTLKSDYSTLYNEYQTVVSDYNSLAGKYSKLYISFTNLTKEYANLSAKYENLSAEYNMLTGLSTIYDFYVSLAQVNTQQIESMMVGPMPIFFQITSPPANVTVVGTPSNLTSTLAVIGKHLSQYFDYISVRGYIKDLVIYPYENYIMGEGLVAFTNLNVNHTYVNTYAIITVVAENVAPYEWQIVYVKIDNSLYVYQYHMASTAFTLVQGLVSRDTAQLISLLIGPYTSYVYIAAGPFKGNYTGLSVENTFIDKIVGIEIKSVSFMPFYFTLTSTSNSTGVVDIYGSLTITLSNGTSYTYFTELHVSEALEPDGEFQVTGLNILNDLTLSQIEAVLPK